MDKILKRFNRYVFNSLKVAIVCLCFVALQYIPWDTIPAAPLSGKIFVGVITWAIWNFMVMIVDVQDDEGKAHEA